MERSRLVKTLTQTSIPKLSRVANDREAEPVLFDTNGCNKCRNKSYNDTQFVPIRIPLV